MQEDVKRLAANWSRTMQNSMKSSGLDMVHEEDDRNLSEPREHGVWKYRVVDEGTPAEFAIVIGCDSDDAELAVPAELDGVPVRELGKQALRGRQHLVHIELPPSIDRIAEGCFTQCRSLESLVLPDGVASLDGSVFSGCTSLREVHLPGSLAEIPSRLFFSCPVAVVRIPAATRHVADDAFNKRALERIEIDGDNPLFSTDGLALFDHEGDLLIRCFVQVESYQVPDGCLRIGEGAFKSMSSLREVDLGPSLETIDAFAFFHTGLERLVCPDSLRVIGEKAFTGTKLSQVLFDSGLRSIGPQAFSQTCLSRIELPAGLEELGKGSFSLLKNGVDTAGALSIDPANKTLSFDGSALYSRKGGELALVQFFDNAERYEVREGTTAIGPSAFEDCKKLEEVVLPDSVESIGDRAFCNCKQLRDVTLPAGLRSIGDSAFYNAPVKRIEIEEKVESIGQDAFAVSDGIMGEYNQIDFELVVSPDNPRFYAVDEVLIERGETGDRAIVYTGGSESVHLPETVVEVAGGAFRNAEVRELFVPAALRNAPLSSFFGIHGLERVHLAFPEEVDGYMGTTLLYPPDPRDLWDTSRTLVSEADGSFLKFFDYDSLAVHEQDVGLVVKIALSRLAEPVRLSASARANYHSALDHYLGEALEQFVLQDDVQGVRLVYERGLLDDKALESVLESAEESEARRIIEFLESKRG